MKQKNILLVALAVGCGLAAAYLTTQMSARPAKAAEQTVAVLVAAKDIPVGTTLKKEGLDGYLEVKEFNPEAVPAQYVALKEELADKRTTRTIRKGDVFNPADVTKFASLSPPAGFNMMSVECSLERGVAGFAQPGSKVDIIAAIPVKTRRRAGDSGGGGQQNSYIVPLLTDMLVLAVDSQAQVNVESQVVPTMSMVSFAVKPEQTLLLHAAKHRGSDLRLVLRNPEKPPVYERMYTYKELWSILAEDPTFNEEEPENPEAPKVETVKLPIAREEVAAGTKLTQDVIDTKFEMKEFTKPAPPQAIEDLRAFTGKYLTSKLGGGQFVPKSFVGEKESKAAPLAVDSASPKAGPAEVAKQPDAPKEKPPVFHDYTVQTPNGVKKYRYQKLPNGDVKFLGEVAHDGAADKTPSESEADAPAPKPKAAPQSGPKAEKSGDPI